MGKNDYDIESLRRELLDEVWAMATTGTPAAILSESEIRNADDDELLEIARQHGLI